jgi:hypothetical protein
MQANTAGMHEARHEIMKVLDEVMAPRAVLLRRRLVLRQLAARAGGAPQLQQLSGLSAERLDLSGVVLQAPHRLRPPPSPPAGAPPQTASQPPNRGLPHCAGGAAGATRLRRFRA